MGKYFILLCLLVASSSSLAIETRVYRAAMDSPESVKRAGGFHPRGMDGSRPNQPPPNINLWDHVRGANTGMSRHDSGYVATTTSRGLAQRWVNDHLNHNGYIYHIRATPNFIDVNETLRQYSIYAQELENAALGTIRWNQIIGWERVRGGQVGAFTPNPDYNGRLYRNLTSSGAQPQLAGFPAGHPAWGLQPWIAFAHCEIRSETRSSCHPNQTAQTYGKKMFMSALRQVMTPWLTMLNAKEESKPEILPETTGASQ